MRVQFEDLASAMRKVKEFADGQKNVPGVMLDVEDDIMKVCYTDGKKAIVEKIELLDNETDISGKIVVPYSKIMEVIDICQPSGPVYTDDLDITLVDDKMLSIKTKKLIEMGDEDGVEEKTVSMIRRVINFHRPEDSIQYQVLARVDYDAIFNWETFDIWDKDTLKEVLTRASTEKNRIVYLSSISKSAFVVNLASVTNIPIQSCENHGMVIPTFIANALVGIMNRMEGDKVLVRVDDNRYANIATDDDKVGVWFEMAPASKTDVATLKRYEEKEYDQYRLTFCRHPLQNVLGCAISVDSSERTSLLIGKGEDGELVASIKSTTSSQSDDFKIVLEDHKDNVGDLIGKKIQVSLRVLYDMIGNCQEYYIAMDIASDESGVYMRVSDIQGVDDSTGDYIRGITHYTVSAR